MKRSRIFRFCAGALGALLLFSMCACKKKQQSTCLSTTAPLEDELVTAAACGEAGFDTYVILNDENTTINGSGAAFEDGVLTVQSPGTYFLRGTLSDGAVVIRTDGREEVALILSGVALHCNGGIPLKIESAPGGARLVLEKDTVNEISDGLADERNDDSSAAVIFSSDRLTIEGEGLLTVKGENDGITAGCVTLSGGTLLVDAGDDSLLAADAFAARRHSRTTARRSWSRTDGSCAVRAMGLPPMTQ